MKYSAIVVLILLGLYFLGQMTFIAYLTLCVLTGFGVPFLLNKKK